MNPKARRGGQVVGGVLLIAFGLAFVAFPLVIQELIGYSALSRAALTQTDASIDRNMLTFASVSGIKAVVALLEGSSVGVGFDLEVGDLVQPAYDYIHFIWSVFLWALLLLSLYKLLMETELLGLGFLLIGVGFILGGAANFARWRLAPWRRWARLFVVVGLLFAYLLPLSLMATEFISERYLARAKAANAERIAQVQVQLNSARDDLLALREQISILSPGESFEAVRASTLSIIDNLTETIWDSMFAFLIFVLILMVELLLLPFLNAYLLYKLFIVALRNIERNVWGVSPTPSASG